MVFLRYLLKKYHGVIWPSKEKIRAEERLRCADHTVEKIEITDWIRKKQKHEDKTLIGAFVDRNDLIKKTVFELHELGALQEKIEQAISLGSNQIILDLHFKDGWDSCGGQVEIRDKWCKEFYDDNEKLDTLEFAGMVLLQVDSEGKPVWINDRPNSENAVKPLAMVLGKETRGLQEYLINRFPEKIPKAFVHLPNGMTVEIRSKVTRCMFDGKLRDILTGRGGFCNQCPITQKDWHDTYTLMMGTEVTFDSIEKLQAAYKKVSHHSLDWGGEHLNQKVDSEVRNGFCHKPLIAPAYTVVLHGWLRCCETMLDNIAILLMPAKELCVDTVKWNHRFEEKLSDKVKEKRLLFCHEFKRRTRIVLSNVGQGRTGGGLVGGHAKNFFNSPEKVKEVLEELVPDEHKHFIDDLIDLLKRLCKIVGLVNSNEEVHTESFRVFCLNTANHILTRLPFYRMTPTMHGILAHSHHWMKMNNDRGLSCYDETALEASHKRTKRSRIFQAFQGSLKDNLSQAMRVRMMESNLVIKYEIESSTKYKSFHKLDPEDEVIKRLIKSGVRISDLSREDADDFIYETLNVRKDLSNPEGFEDIELDGPTPVTIAAVDR